MIGEVPASYCLVGLCIVLFIGLFLLQGDPKRLCLFGEVMDVSGQVAPLWVFIAMDEWRKPAVEVMEIAHSFECESLVGVLCLQVPICTWGDAGLSAEVFDQIAFVQSVFFKQPQLDLCFREISLPLLQDPGVIAD